MVNCSTQLATWLDNLHGSGGGAEVVLAEAEYQWHPRGLCGHSTGQ